jgi:hypothetical protein
LPHAVPPEQQPLGAEYDKLGYEQLCGPIDPATGYGTGWAQLGTNTQGQNLYVIDAVSDILHYLEGGKTSPHWRAEYAAGKTAPDYVKLEYEQEAGAVAEDGYGHGWPQLGGRSLTDAVAHIKNVLAGEPPPFQKARQTAATGEGSLGASIRVAGQPSSPSGALGRLREPGTRPT